MQTTFYIKQDLIQLLDWRGDLITYDVPLHLVQFDAVPIPTWTGPEWNAHLIGISNNAFGAPSNYSMSNPEHPFMWYAAITTESEAPIFLWADDTAHGGQLLVGAWSGLLDGSTHNMILDPYAVNVIIGYGGGGFQMMPGEIACVPEASSYGAILGLVCLGVAALTRLKGKRAS